MPVAAFGAFELMRIIRAMEMEVTMVGLQNAGKTSLLRVLAVGCPNLSLSLCFRCVGAFDLCFAR